MLGVWVNISVGEAAAFGEAVMLSHAPAGKAVSTTVTLDLAVPFSQTVAVNIAVGLTLMDGVGSFAPIPALIGVMVDASTGAADSNAVVLVTVAVAVGTAPDAQATMLTSPALMNMLGMDTTNGNIGAVVVHLDALSGQDARCASFQYTIMVGAAP